MIDFTAHIETESQRFLSAVTTAVGGDGAALAVSVPTCPDWSLADLVWHLTEVQHFWSHIVGRGLDGPQSYDRPTRPSDGELIDTLSQAGTDLLAALDGKPDDHSCWSWYEGGGSVGWVRRRQAHEALIHRVDAESVGGRYAPIDEELGADGVDEMLRIMLDVGELPTWATFDPEPAPVVLDVGDRQWSLHLGRFTGTPPDGEPLDLPALSVGPDGAVPSEPAPVTVISGRASDLDRWLWGRGTVGPLTVEGDPDAAVRLRATAADATA